MRRNKMILVLEVTFDAESEEEARNMVQRRYAQATAALPNADVIGERFMFERACGARMTDPIAGEIYCQFHEDHGETHSDGCHVWTGVCYPPEDG